MKLQFDTHSLGTGSAALEIGVKGFQGDPSCVADEPSQVYIEIYEGKLRVCVWDGSSQDPQITVIDVADSAPRTCPQCGGCAIFAKGAWAGCWAEADKKPAAIEVPTPPAKIELVTRD